MATEEPSSTGGPAGPSTIKRPRLPQNGTESVGPHTSPAQDPNPSGGKTTPKPEEAELSLTSRRIETWSPGAYPAEALQAVTAVTRHLHLPQLQPVNIHVRVRTFDSLRHRNYRLLWAVTVFSAGGFWLQQVIIGWLTYDLTRSPLWTSLALGLEALPVFLIGPVGGLLVDKWDRRKLLALISTYQALVTFGFSALVFLGLAQTWHIFGFIILMGVSWALHDPARISLIPNIVPRGNLTNAFALNSLAFSVTRLIAPAIGGVLLALVGPGPTLLLEGAMQLVAIAMALGLQVTPSPRSRMKLTAAFPELLQAARYIRREPVILALLLFGVVPPLLVNPYAQGLMPVFAVEVFGVGPRGLGLLLSAVGAGATIGTVYLASLGDIRRKGRLVIVSLILAGVTMALYSVNPFFWAAFPILMLLSAGLMVYYAISSATVQGIVKDEFRGRVAGLLMMGSWGLLPVGSLVAGILAEYLGAPMATLIAVGILVVVFTPLLLRFRALWKVQ